ncbi:hypothetical protein INT45_013871 [Circinella minor]|uniref:Uncharacterized protein n=1 Tax=Circinella minor TaxID=1195481 RepID=A0A8H7S0Z4_9FUNG|nr:hypothetical protein INT45_013871 [Circinella minor]
MSSSSKQTRKNSNKQNYFQWKKKHILSLIEVLGKSVGEGIDDEDEKLKIETIRAKVLLIEPFFDELGPLIRDRPKATPHFNADSESTDLSQQADTFLLNNNGVDELDEEEESSDQEETRNNHDGVEVEVVEEATNISSRKRSGDDELQKKTAKKPRKSAANITASLLRMVEAKADIEKDKIKYRAEINDKRFELEKEKKWKSCDSKLQ